MNVRAIGTALLTAVAAFLVTVVGVAELLAPTIEFSLFVALPAGVLAALVVAAVVFFAFGDESSADIATALGAYALTVIVVLAVLGFGVGVGVVLALVVGVVVGALVAAGVLLRLRLHTK